MPLILVRYGEIGLKSTSVRRRFERSLVENIENAFMAAKAQCRIDGERGRIYVSVDEVEAASTILRRVFGIVSFSAVEEVPSDLDSVKAGAVSLALRMLGKDESFAVRCTRQGSHPYTSMVAAKDVGQAILDAATGLGTHVDLDSPDKEIRIEIRNARAFIFHNAVKGPGGLPMGSQGKVLAIVERPRDCAAAWLMMRRGCKAAILAEDESLVAPLARWDPHLRVHSRQGDPVETVAGKLKCGAVVIGGTLAEAEALSKGEKMPVLHPLVGLSEAEIDAAVASIAAGIPPNFSGLA
jgi:thiamine biosynthesis protein ThiI